MLTPSPFRPKKPMVALDPASFAVRRETYPVVRGHSDWYTIDALKVQEKAGVLEVQLCSFTQALFDEPQKSYAQLQQEGFPGWTLTFYARWTGTEFFHPGTHLWSKIQRWQMLCTAAALAACSQQPLAPYHAGWYLYSR